MPKDHQSHATHVPVLVDEVLHYLKPEAGQSYLDLTAGYGGHARAVLEKTGSPEQATLVDRDSSAASRLKEVFAAKGARIIHQDFLGTSRQLRDAHQQFDLILADLGISSLHIGEASRGFSIRNSGPLDMRMDQSQKLSAGDIVNKWDVARLERLLKDYGQEPKARKIAGLIVDNRPIISTAELAAIARRAWPGHSRVHPATRTFQALRIAVNDELQQLGKSLPLWLELLKPGGRLVVISFHSLEDRLVKNFFAEHGREGYTQQLELLTKKPVVASPEEIVLNPRARSAKLRAVAKIKTKK